MRDKHSPTLCHPVPIAHLRKIEFTGIYHLMTLSYSRLNSFTSNELSFLTFTFKCLAINLSPKRTKCSLFLYISRTCRLTNILAYLNFCGINSSKKRDLCYRYGDHKVKADLSLVFFQIP